MGISKELKGLNKHDVDHAYYEIDMIRRKTAYLKSESDLKANRILGIVQDILMFIRDTFWNDQGVFQKPSVFNILKWIRIVVFIVRQVRAIINVTNR